MTNTSTINIGEFNAIVSRDASLMKASRGFGRILFAPMVIFKHERKNQKVIEGVRQLMASCTVACDDGSCLSGLYDQIIKVRDGYVEIVDLVEQTPLPEFLKRPARNNLADWDDLAEDCLIGGDQDIRKSIREIANLL